MLARALHYVFKIGDRQKSYDFFVKLLGMKVLRHEEFMEGCAAECNGPYNGWWSKTMIGYGGEDEHFVLELTYNYSVGSYRLGNDFRAIYIDNDAAFKRVSESGTSTKDESGRLHVKDPDGHLFIVSPGSNPKPITKVAVNVANLQKSVDYWSGLLTMNVLEKTDRLATLTYGSGQASWELHHLSSVVDRGTAYGRIAFSYPGSELKALEDRMKAAKSTILKPLLTLQTPGKADVQVVILADPDGHEICFVGAEGFAQLSQIDPNADASIQKAIKEDTSADWFKDGKQQG